MLKHKIFWRGCDEKKVAGNDRHSCFVKRNVLSCAQGFSKMALQEMETLSRNYISGNILNCILQNKLSW
jgi:hypothetical protein